MTIKFIINRDGLVEDQDGKVVFRSSISQQDAREAVHQSIEEKGYMIDEEWEMDDDSIEITICD